MHYLLTCLFVTASSFWDLRMSRSQTGSERVVGRSNGGRAERPRSEFMPSTSSANKIWMNYVWSCFYVKTIVTIMFFLILIFYWFLGIVQWCCDGGVVPLFFFFLFDISLKEWYSSENSNWNMLGYSDKKREKTFRENTLKHLSKTGKKFACFALRKYFLCPEFQIIFYWI